MGPQFSKLSMILKSTIKCHFLNENVEFLFVDVLRTKEVAKSPMLYPYSLHVTSLCIAAVLQMAGTNGN